MFGLQIFLAVHWTTSHVYGNHLPQMTAFALLGCFAKSAPCFLSGCFGSGLDSSPNDCYKNSICQTEELMLMDLCQKQLTWLSWLGKYQYSTCKGLREVYSCLVLKFCSLILLLKGMKNKHTEYSLKKNQEHWMLVPQCVNCWNILGPCLFIWFCMTWLFIWRLPKSVWAKVTCLKVLCRLEGRSPTLNQHSSVS